MKYDVVILTDHRYINPTKRSVYCDNVLLEDHLVLEALQKIGLKATRKSWDDSDFDWSSTKFALFRTTWDYFDRFQEFSQWFKQTSKSTQFINSKTLIDWNIDKHYLKDLNSKGVNIPNTLFLETGERLDLERAIEKANQKFGFTCEDFVLKPCVSGAARHTYKFHKSEWQEHNAIFQQLLAQESLMLQEFQEEVMKQGEISLMLFNGKFTHAVLKIAKPGDFRVQDDFGGTVHEYVPSEDQIAFAKSVVEATPELPIYSRVDIFKDNTNQWALAELEIFEPELWFRLNPSAANVLAESIKETYFLKKT